MPEAGVPLPIGKGRIVREGKDVTLIAYGSMVPLCEKAAEAAQQQGRSVEIVDPRTLVPLDEPLLLESVKKTGRCVVVYEAPKTCGYGAEIAVACCDAAVHDADRVVVLLAGRDLEHGLAGLHFR